MKRNAYGVVIALLLLAAAVAGAGGKSESSTPTVSGPTTISVWSHFANEPLFRKVISHVFDDYMAKNSKVKIDVKWYDKQPLRESIRTVMQAGGKGAPDITTFDHEDVQWAEAGWLEPLDAVLDFSKFVDGAKSAGSYPDLKMAGTFKFNMAMVTEYILYNKKIFADLGIKVPADGQFTDKEFIEVIRKVKAAGYDGFANGIGDRPYPGQYLSKAALLSLVGPEEFNRLWTGKVSWNSPKVRQALQFVVDCGKAGAWPASFATMTLDESHLYFHTQQKAAMFIMGSFYPSRAFKPVDQGGQPDSFRFGMLKYPRLEGATAPNAIISAFPTGYAVLSSSTNKAIALDILKFWSSNPQYGAEWAAVTNLASAIRYEQSDVPAALRGNPRQWYWDEFNSVYGKSVFALHGVGCGDFNNALVSTLNQGLPLGLMSVDQVIDYLDKRLCK